ncbi:ShlB/FhaC/HecB family hemolysin secretion/activation protein [Stenotrophomonas rhizophila]|uniref:Hemolysin activation/secretion protein n=1 Tax=Stenotrophomonas rhizophila TaxID=216778 RepID=A0AAW5PKI6_9GAMM|nr:ShlB/FhaC/HecB family hemolysin secretion/activation protein [Stenotrophomonas rhizophila]MCS4280916.1 hemolysin activation/secretion protein [Stenotrophomonas rhizophila]
MPNHVLPTPARAGSHGASRRTLLLAPLAAALALICLPASAQQLPAPDQELLRQQERERALREQLETRPDARLQDAPVAAPERLPQEEAPCFVIERISLGGEQAERFQWALAAANVNGDPALGRCLGTTGINVVMSRVQNAIVERGFVTTRVLAQPQDLTTGALELTLVPGTLRQIRFAEGTHRDATMWNAIPARSGDLLNLRDIEQGLENFKRVPTAEADIQISPAEGADAAPGQSDLVVQWSQQRLVRFNLSLDDSGSKATGKTQAGATMSLDHALRQNDLFYVNLNHDVFSGGKRGTKGFTFHYSVPVGYWLFGATRSGYEYEQTVAGNQQSYLYSGESYNAEVRATRLLFRTASSKTSMYLRAWERDSRNFIDDTEILVQRRRMGGWELGLNHRHFIGQATLDGTFGFRRGTGAFGSIAAPEELFGEATSHPKIYFADAQLSVPFQLGQQRLRYTGSWRAQWNRGGLVPQDRFAIGGRYTVRGFDGEMSLMGERGWLIRNDIGLALGGGQEFYVGADYGHVGGSATQWQLGNDLAGTVIGLRGSYRGLYWDGFVGAPLNKPSGFQNAYTVTGFTLSWSF